MILILFNLKKKIFTVEKLCKLIVWEKNWYITYDFTLIKIAAVQEDGVTAGIPFSQKSLNFFMKLLRLQMNSWEGGKKTIKLWN